MKAGILVTALVALLLSACSTRVAPEGVAAFHRRDYKAAEEVFRSKIPKSDDKDYVLYNLALLSSAMMAGDTETAKKAASEARTIMWSDAGQGRGQASLVSAEAIKVFKGEPFEKSMAAVYEGILFYNQGDFDNARAAFGKALLAVRQKEDALDDFALPLILQAKMFLRDGDEDNARIALEKAKKAGANGPAVDAAALKRANVIVLVELGKAPKKARTGPGASLVEWRRTDYPERQAAVFLNDREVGRAAEVGDLTHQAQTKGWTGKDTVQVTKGIAREAATATAVIAASEAASGNQTAGWVALGAGLFALANQSQADVRQWELLPDRILLYPLRVSTGQNSIGLVFLDSKGRRLSGYDQVWYQGALGPTEQRILLLRGGPGR